MIKLTEEEKERGAKDRWDSLAAEPLKDRPIPKEILEKLKKEGRL